MNTEGKRALPNNFHLIQEITKCTIGLFLNSNVIPMLPIQILELSPIITFHNQMMSNKVLSSTVRYQSIRLAYLIYGMALQVWDLEHNITERKLVKYYSSSEFSMLCSLDGYTHQAERLAAVYTVLRALKYAIEHELIEHLACHLMEVTAFDNFKPLEICIQQWLKKIIEKQYIEEIEDRFKFESAKQKARVERLFKHKSGNSRDGLYLHFATIEEAREFRKFLREYVPGTYETRLIGMQYQIKLSLEVCNKIAPGEHYLRSTYFQNHFQIPYHQLSHAVHDFIMQPDYSIQEKMDVVSEYSDSFLQLLHETGAAYGAQEISLIVFYAQHASKEGFLNLLQRLKPPFNSRKYLNITEEEYVAHYQSEYAFSMYMHARESALDEAGVHSLYESLRAKDIKTLSANRTYYPYMFHTKEGSINELLSRTQEEIISLVRYAALENNTSFMVDFLKKATSEQVKKLLKKLSHDVLIDAPDFLYLLAHLALFDFDYLSQLYATPGPLHNYLVSAFPNKSTLKVDILTFYFMQTRHTPILLHYSNTNAVAKLKPNTEKVLRSLPLDLLQLIYSTNHSWTTYNNNYLPALCSEITLKLIPMTEVFCQRIQKNLNPGYLLEFFTGLMQKNEQSTLKEQFLIYLETIPPQYLQAEVDAFISRGKFMLLFQSMEPVFSDRFMMLASENVLCTQLNSIMSYLASSNGNLFIEIARKIHHRQEFIQVITMETNNSFNPLKNILGTLVTRQSPTVVNQFLALLSGHGNLFFNLIKAKPLAFANLYTPCLNDPSVNQIPQDIWNIIANPQSNMHAHFVTHCQNHPTLSAEIKACFLNPQQIVQVREYQGVFIEQLKERISTNQILIKITREERWNEISDMISHRNIRPALRRQRLPEETWRLNLKTGVIERYGEKKSADTPRTYTKKTSATLIAQSRNTAAFGEHLNDVDMVGFFFLWPKCDTRAMFLQDCATYNRTWAGKNKPALEKYKQSVRGKLFYTSQREEFINRVNEAPFGHNELLVCLPYDKMAEVIHCIVIARDTPNARKIARERQDELYLRLGVHKEIVFYDRFIGGLKLYHARMQELDCPGREHILNERTTCEDPDRDSREKDTLPHDNNLVQENPALKKDTFMGTELKRPFVFFASAPNQDLDSSPSAKKMALERDSDNEGFTSYENML